MKAALTTLVVLSLYLAAALSAQRVSPLVYDDPEFAWLDNRDPDSPRPSPNAVSGMQIGSARVWIAYGSPGAKGRRIFGGLVPYGRIWRTGANEATTVTVTRDVLVEGKRLEKGTYSLFTVPKEAEWTLIFSRDDNQWGAYDYDVEEDVLRLTVPSREASFRENFWIGFDEISPDGLHAVLVLHWERTRVGVRIEEAL